MGEGNRAAQGLRVQLNGQDVVLQARATVSDVLASLGCGTRGVAVAVNAELVRRSDWPSVELSEGDRVEVLHAVAGG
ncbi:MAG TPA: sulfur carrier protein ThiS [Acidimicrobiales bacterium]|nr:sulfur carrier protein ThiS [Acidimicrobiales bacterium]